jgi:citrate lyase gamma subunit|tara:strand:+ start:231 stop:953 length:723 start_codon:yes stop_codon:yes gene_type:complete
MPLPQISTPTYELTIPSSKKKIKYRPFLVREEKILILALESENEKQIADAIKSTLKSCIQTRGVKVEDLPTFDIEYIFLNIRGKSVGESIDLVITCPDDLETTVDTKIYIDEIQVDIDEKHNPDIKLDSNLTLRMKYPSLNQFIKNNFSFKDDNDSIDQSFDLIASCIDIVYSEEESWAASDCTKKELREWLETLNSQQFKKVETFFQTMPKLSHKVKVTNPKTKVESEVALEGLTSFFE